MTIHLPEDLESSIRAEVESGRFASVDEAVVEAVRLLLGRPNPGETGAKEPTNGNEEVAPGRKPIWEVFQEISASIPDEVRKQFPADSSEQLDHYVYGTPKRPTPR